MGLIGNLKGKFDKDTQSRYQQLKSKEQELDEKGHKELSQLRQRFEGKKL